jgi:hypothetical protein
MEMTRLAILILFFLGSCTNPPKTTPVLPSLSRLEGKVLFEDIDMKSFQGVNRLSEVSYPCISIKDSAAVKTITFYTSRDHSFSREYFQKGDFWENKFYFKADTSMWYMYEMVLEDRIITFNYPDTSSNIILEVSVATDKLHTIYFPKGQIKFEPKIANLDSVINKSSSRYIEEYSVTDSILHRSATKIDSNGRIEFHYNNCYLANHKSVFWHTYLAHTLKNISCPNTIK